MPFSKLGLYSSLVRGAQALGYAEPTPIQAQAIHAVLRSEERRVGKECRSRWSPYH